MQQNAAETEQRENFNKTNKIDSIMADFIYQEPYPIEKDTTEYELVTKDYVKVVECDGRKILKVDPKGLELLSKRACASASG